MRALTAALHIAADALQASAAQRLEILPQGPAAAVGQQQCSLLPQQWRQAASAAEAVEEPDSPDIILTDTAQQVNTLATFLLHQVLPACLPPDAHTTLQQLRELLTHSQEGESVLRLTVEAGGCSGFSYKFDLEKGAKSDDRRALLCFGTCYSAGMLFAAPLLTNIQASDLPRKLCMLACRCSQFCSSLWQLACRLSMVPAVQSVHLWGRQTCD